MYVLKGSSILTNYNKGLTSSVIRVAIDRPISWYWGPFPIGPSRMKRNLFNREDGRFWVKVVSFTNNTFRGLSYHVSRNIIHKIRNRYEQRSQDEVFVYYLVVMGTSARPLSSTAGARRMKATTGRSRNSSSPTRTLDASAPGGIFFMKWRSICETGRPGLRTKDTKTFTTGLTESGYHQSSE